MRVVAIMLAVAAGLTAAPALASETITYSYDALGRLIKAAHGGSVNNGQQTTYTQDPADNRNNVTVGGASH